MLLFKEIIRRCCHVMKKEFKKRVLAGDALSTSQHLSNLGSQGAAVCLSCYGIRGKVPVHHRPNTETGPVLNQELSLIVNWTSSIKLVDFPCDLQRKHLKNFVIKSFKTVLIIVILSRKISGLILHAVSIVSHVGLLPSLWMFSLSQVFWETAW